MIDHIGLDVGDYERSKAFYEQALAPLGIELLMEPVPDVGGFRRTEAVLLDRPRGRAAATACTSRSPSDRATVDAFHAAALAAGGTTTAGRACARSTTPTTTAPSCSTRTATTSRPSAML